MNSSPPPDDPLLNLRFLRLTALIAPNGLYPVGKSTLYSWIKQGKFPAPVKIGPRLSGWSLPTIIAHHEQLEKKGKQDV